MSINKIWIKSKIGYSTVEKYISELKNEGKVKKIDGKWGLVK